MTEAPTDKQHEPGQSIEWHGVDYDVNVFAAYDTLQSNFQQSLRLNLLCNIM